MTDPNITLFETCKSVLALPIVSAIIGGLIAGLFALLALIINHKHDLARDDEAQKEKLLSYYRSLQAELEVLRAYYKALGKYHEKFLEG